jgi:hypothetical protein
MSPAVYSLKDLMPYCFKIRECFLGFNFVYFNITRRSFPAFENRAWVVGASDFVADLTGEKNLS